jgi:hypothetical protein
MRKGRKREVRYITGSTIESASRASLQMTLSMPSSNPKRILDYARLVTVYTRQRNPADLYRHCSGRGQSTAPTSSFLLRPTLLAGNRQEPSSGASLSAGRYEQRKLLSDLQSANGSVTSIVSSRCGDVDTNVTGHSISSSMRRIYLIACAGSSAQLRAPAVVPCQPSIVS